MLSRNVRLKEILMLNSIPNCGRKMNSYDVNATELDRNEIKNVSTTLKLFQNLNHVKISRQERKMISCEQKEMNCWIGRRKLWESLRSL